jgi:hypothetical protein
MKRKITATLLTAALVLSLTACGGNDETVSDRENRDRSTQANADDTAAPTTTSEPDTTTTNTPDSEPVNVNPFTDVSAGDTVEFSGANWLVLAVEGEKALILREEILALRDSPRGLSYVPDDDTTHWENNPLRAWLNDDFFATFGDVEQSYIIETELTNPACAWFPDRRPAGANTLDKVFLLSVEEALEYFGGGVGALDEIRQGATSVGNHADTEHYSRSTVEGRWVSGNPQFVPYINDDFNENRIATQTGTVGGSTFAWRLRDTRGDVWESADMWGVMSEIWGSYSAVTIDGLITPSVAGNADIRPAMWVDVSPRV